MKLSLLAFAMLASITAMAQGTAPSNVCDLSKLPAYTPIRILAGSDPVPYNFACRKFGREDCVASNLNPGLIVSAGPEQKGWICVSGADSSFGWVPTTRLASVPAKPSILLDQWLGWWHQGPDTPGIERDRLLITRGKSLGTLHISGRAFWYGRHNNVHFGGVNADAAPIGLYLHVVEGDDLSGCVLDLTFDRAAHGFTAYDNAHCGGMNVRFRGTWSRFTPSGIAPIQKQE